MSAFFSNDFTQERWRKAALKNAYALLGKQRFVHAAAFFLLANALWDAVEVWLNCFCLTIKLFFYFYFHLAMKYFFNDRQTNF